MLSSHAMVRLTLLAPLLIGAGCSSPAGRPCCDDAKSDGPSDPADDGPSANLMPDAESEAAALDQAPALDKQAAVDWAAETRAETLIDGSETRAADAPAGEAAWPSLVPDGGALLFSDFEDGKTDGWRSIDRNDGGTADHDWSVFLGDTGWVYSEGSLDTSEWHLSCADSNAIADQIVEAKMRVVEFYDIAPSFVAALFARYDSITDSGYFVALRGDGSVIIRKRVQGKSASWAAGVDAGIVPGRWYTVRLEVLGSSVNAFLDGQLVYSVVDSDPLAKGSAALGSYGATLEVDSIFLAQP